MDNKPRGLTEGPVKKGGINSPPKTPKPKIAPVAQNPSRHQYGPQCKRCCFYENLNQED